MTQSTDSKLLSQAANGDRRAFGEFYEIHLKEIYRYIFFRVYDHDEAEDLTTKVFLEAWEGLRQRPSRQKINNIRAWIYRIAHHKVVDYLRTRKQHISMEDHLDQDLQTAGLEMDVDDLFMSQKLVNGVRQLSDIYQQVIILRFVNRMSHAEAAEILGITESHVRVLQHRALQRMREVMTEVNNL